MTISSSALRLQDTNSWISARNAALVFMMSSVSLGFFGALFQLPLSFGTLAVLSEIPFILCSSNGSERPRTSVSPISSGVLPDDPGKRVTAVRVTFPPNALSPKHHHEASLYVYVLKGKIRSQLQGQPAQEFDAGDSFHEPEGSVHLFAENLSTSEPAEVLAVFVHKDGANLTVYH
jgi:quercetin dioxygenase-like cupin family protein